MEFRMANDEIVQQVEIYLCKCKVFAEDKRVGKKVHLTIWFTLQKSEEEPKPIVEKILGKLGYFFYSFDDRPEFSTLAENADELFEISQSED